MSDDAPRDMNDDELTLSEVLRRFAADGFTQDMFVTREAMVRCGSCHHDTPPAELILDKLRRLEGTSDPADMAAVLGVTCTVCGAKGSAVVRFGPEAEEQDDAVLLAVEDRRFSDG